MAKDFQIAFSYMSVPNFTFILWPLSLQPYMHMRLKVIFQKGTIENLRGHESHTGTTVHSHISQQHSEGNKSIML